MNQNFDSTNAKIVVPTSYEDLDFICNRFDSPMSSHKFLDAVNGICLELPQVLQQQTSGSHGVEEQAVKSQSS